MITATDLKIRAGARTLAAPDTVLYRLTGSASSGRNGAGKTTSLRILAGETEPTLAPSYVAVRWRLPPWGSGEGDLPVG